VNECQLIGTVPPESFASELERLSRAFKIYYSTSTEPLPSKGLAVTREIRLQSELYLPLAWIRRTAFSLYRSALPYPPVYSSSPFYSPLSWADCFVMLPEWLQISPDPSVIFSALLNDRSMLERFIFHSFLPSRFNGPGFNRYPEQSQWLANHLQSIRQNGKRIRVLDAACGSGEGTWEISSILMKNGWDKGSCELTGWTLDPLEVWAAENIANPDDEERFQYYREYVRRLMAEGSSPRPRFYTVNLLESQPKEQQFEIIVCNGLAGGPIINCEHGVKRLAHRLSNRLSDSGILLLADRFHGGWKKKTPEAVIRSNFASHGLEPLYLGGEHSVFIRSATGTKG